MIDEVVIRDITENLSVDTSRIIEAALATLRDDEGARSMTLLSASVSKDLASLLACMLDRIGPKAFYLTSFFESREAAYRQGMKVQKIFGFLKNEDLVREARALAWEDTSRMIEETRQDARLALGIVVGAYRQVLQDMVTTHSTGRAEAIRAALKGGKP